MGNPFTNFIKKYDLDSIFKPSDLSFLNVSNKDALKSDIQNIANDMKKILTLIVILCAMCSCNKKPDTNVYHEVEKTNDVYEVYRGLQLKVVVIDSCEYLIGDNWSGYQGYGYMSHKGNCKYCAERRKRELKNCK